MIKICISVTSHALDPLPLSQTVTPTRTPSSVTYFMDGPLADSPRSSNAIGPERRGLQICDLTRSYNFFKFLSNDYTNPNTNPKTLTAGILTYPDDAIESFCAPAFCDFIRNYSGTDVCPLVTSILISSKCACKLYEAKFTCI